MKILSEFVMYANNIINNNEEKHSYVMKYTTFPGLKEAQIYLEFIQNLIVVDCTSNFFDISKIRNKRSSTVVLHCLLSNNIFQIWYSQRSYIRQRSRNHRICLENNSEKWNFKHTISSPVHPPILPPSPPLPQSNRQVERTLSGN